MRSRSVRKDPRHSGSSPDGSNWDVRLGHVSVRGRARPAPAERRPRARPGPAQGPPKLPVSAQGPALGPLTVCLVPRPPPSAPGRHVSGITRPSLSYVAELP